MPKIKTCRSAAKRIKVTSSGKIQRRKTFSGCHHLLEKKSPKRKRNFRKMDLASSSDRKKLTRLAPYKF